MTDNNTTELINKIINSLVQKAPELKGCVSVVVTDDLTGHEQRTLQYARAEYKKYSNGRGFPEDKYKTSARICYNNIAVDGLSQFGDVEVELLNKLYNKIQDLTTAEIRCIFFKKIWIDYITTRDRLTNVLNRFTEEGYKIYTIEFSKTDASDDSVYVLAHAPVIITGSGN